MKLMYLFLPVFFISACKETYDPRGQIAGTYRGKQIDETINAGTITHDTTEVDVSIVNTSLENGIALVLPTRTLNFSYVDGVCTSIADAQNKGPKPKLLVGNGKLSLTDSSDGTSPNIYVFASR